MNQKDYIAIAAILVCTLLNFCFSLAEAAVVTISTNRLRHITRENDENLASADAIRWLVSEPTRVFAAVQLGLTVLSLTSAAIAAVSIAPGLASWLEAHHVGHPMDVAVIILVTLIAILTLVVGEIVPRAIALRNPERVALVVAGPLRWLEAIERPAVMVILWLSNLIVKPFGLTASFNAPVITEDELRTLLEASSKEGVIQEDEKEMLHNVISFGDTLIHKVMTPRVHIKAIEVRQPLEKLINLIVDHGHSRIPVYQDSIDNIIGIIHAKDLLPSLSKGERIMEIGKLTRAPIFVPEQMRTDELLDQMRRSNAQIAIVQDEYGGTAGLVTIEDLLEEIVGEIQDEYDVEEPRIARDDETGAAIVDARLPIDDINEELDLDLSTTDFDTIGGLVFGLFGRPPLVGDSITTLTGPNDDIEVEFTIVKADGRRLQTIRIETRPHEEETVGEEYQSDELKTGNGSEKGS